MLHIFCFQSFINYNTIYHIFTPMSWIMRKVHIADMQPRNVDDCLHRYIKAGLEQAAGCINVSLSGPDGTKLGTDFSAFLGHIMFLNSTPTVAVMPPQVSNFISPCPLHHCSKSFLTPPPKFSIKKSLFVSFSFR